MQRYIFLIAMLMAAVTSQATKPSSALEDPELSQLLDFYQSIDLLETNFQQTKKFKQIKMQLKSEGHLKIQRPDEVRWEITKPSRVVATFDKQFLQLETGEGSQKTVQKLKRDELSERKEAQGFKSLTTWMQMDSKALSQEYEISKLGQSHFQFIPKQKESSPFEKIEMKIEQKKFIQKLSLFEKSGDWIEIHFATPKFKLKK